MAALPLFFVVACLVVGCPPCAATASESIAAPADVTAFQQDISPRVRAARPMADKHWRQIEPALHHLATQHADCLGSMPQADRVATLASLTGFIDRVRAARATRPVLAPGRCVIGLLDPAGGLDPKVITAIAAAFGGTPTVFK
ncbi:MAG: hypothetical protein ACKOOF_02060, partial [Planctomycetaceae bacterium]